MSKLKHALKNDYVKSAIFLAIILGCIGAFWLGLRTYLQTEYPLLAVASGSMIPTLNVGDLIVIQGGLNVNDIIAEEDPIGDIIVFRKPTNPDELIVHRAVEKSQDSTGEWYIRTKGDANGVSLSWEKSLYDEDIVGKVVGNIPYLGRVPLFVHTPTGIMIILLVIVVLILLEFVIPIAMEKTKADQAEEPVEETTVSDTQSQ